MSVELNAEFRRYRAEILRGLVQVAGADDPRVRPVMGQGQGPSDEERLGRLERAFPALADGLARLAARLRQLPEGPVAVLSAATPDRDEMIAKVERARDSVEGLARELVSNGLAPDRIGQIAREVRGPIIEMINDWFPIPKLFVAVHGIGDQFQNQTVQTVAFRVCDYVGEPTALPLGRFHSPGARVGVFLPQPGRDPDLDCGFAEIYWADVPRVPAAEQHTLEEPRKWARTLVQRLRLNSMAPGPITPGQRATDERVEELIEEMIQGVNVADRIASLGDKAGLFHFDLKKILNDFLNDVQVVTEFEDYREQLLDIFGAVMSAIAEYFPASEIYIVAHSEGTVVSFMGLLMGLYERAGWMKMIRGYMTIGSPLNKHVFFWPELFDQFRADQADEALQRRPIPWRNYYDYGDPIGFDLRPTRRWLAESGWDRFFEFQDEDDIGFARYLFPGQAHNEYWNDPGVFGHFIQDVVDPGGRVLKPVEPVQFEKPKGRWVPAILSYPMPYALAAVLLLIGCYVLFKAVQGCLDPVGAEFQPPMDVIRNVLGLWGLIAGMSLMARIPRLAGHPVAWALGITLGVATTLLYLVVPLEDRRTIQQFLGSRWSDPDMARLENLGLIAASLAAVVVAVCAGRLRDLRPIACTLVPVLLWIVMWRFLLRETLTDGELWKGLAVLSTAWVIGLCACLATWYFPKTGTRPLVFPGALIILLVVSTMVVKIRYTISDDDRLRLAQAADRFAETAVGQNRDALVRGEDEARRPGAIRSGAAEAPPAIPEQSWSRIRDAAALEVAVARALEEGPIWPVFPAGAAFLYLWWLAIISFDLTFIWHLYIRWGGAQRVFDAEYERAKANPMRPLRAAPPRPRRLESSEYEPAVMT